MTGRLLIIDNNRSARESLALTLGIRGWEVRTAGNMARGLASLKEAPPQVLLIDLDLNDGQALSLIRSLKTHTQNRSLRIIVTSSEPQAGQLLEAYTAGADGFVTRPFSADTLVDLLEGGPGRQGGFRLKELARRARRLNNTTQVG